MPSFLKAELYNPHLPKGSMKLTEINQKYKSCQLMPYAGFSPWIAAN